jgi:hypothetical protein
LVEHELPKREAGAETSTNPADSSLAGQGIKPPETTRNQSGGQLGVDDSSAADLELAIRLKSLADGMARVLINAPGGQS